MKKIKKGDGREKNPSYPCMKMKISKRGTEKKSKKRRQKKKKKKGEKKKEKKKVQASNFQFFYAHLSKLTVLVCVPPVFIHLHQLYRSQQPRLQVAG